MNRDVVHDPRRAHRGPVIALHCSGAGSGEWCHLREWLGESYELLAPEHYGSESTGPWTGEHAFTLADEAARSIALIDQSRGRVHLAGHSYGGGVALAVALARPERIASMVLYEPSAFHLLKGMGPSGQAALAEIQGIADRIGRGVLAGDYRAALAAFIDYWNGPGSWQAMRPVLQQALTRWTPKAPLDFAALIGERTPPGAYGALRCPVLLLVGEHGPVPTRLIAERLLELLPDAARVVVQGAGHMGPITHGPAVAALMARHISVAEDRSSGVLAAGGIAMPPAPAPPLPLGCDPHMTANPS